jgi:isoquinoline 1-oxidoreductase beta subunit
MNRINGHVTVEKLSLVIDAGTVIHPNGAEAQVEGAALWGLSMALHEGSEFVKGQPKDTNLDTYALLRMGDVPDVEVEFLPSTEAPVGLVNRRLRRLHPRLEMPSSPPRAHASVICQSNRKLCW